jgi:hypothetical protein
MDYGPIPDLAWTPAAPQPEVLVPQGRDMRGQPVLALKSAPGGISMLDAIAARVFAALVRDASLATLGERPVADLLAETAWHLSIVLVRNRPPMERPPLVPSIDFNPKGRKP